MKIFSGTRPGLFLLVTFALVACQPPAGGDSSDPGTQDSSLDPSSGGSSSSSTEEKPFVTYEGGELHLTPKIRHCFGEWSSNFGNMELDKGVNFDYYRVHVDVNVPDSVVTLLPPEPAARPAGAEALPGFLANHDPLPGLSRLMMKVISKSSFIIRYSSTRIYEENDFVTIEPQKGDEPLVFTFPSSSSNFFRLACGSAPLCIKEMTITYDGGRYRDDDKYRGAGDGFWRIPPVKHDTERDGPKVSGETQVTVPMMIDVDEAKGTYTIQESKTYTYYNDYKTAPLEAALTDPVDVANYIAAFGRAPVNYVAGSGNQDIRKKFGDKVRRVSTTYDDPGGYAQYVPYVSCFYVEYDLALDENYSSGKRGTGRLVVFTSGFEDEVGGPAILYTDDHYKTFAEYLNWGHFAARFNAESENRRSSYTNYVYSTPRTAVDRA